MKIECNAVNDELVYEAPPAQSAADVIAIVRRIGTPEMQARLQAANEPDTKDAAGADDASALMPVLTARFGHPEGWSFLNLFLNKGSWVATWAVSIRRIAWLPFPLSNYDTDLNDVTFSDLSTQLQQAESLSLQRFKEELKLHYPKK